MKSHTRHAFTLVELLVVIGIIAVLISILLPVLSRAREEAVSLKCLANLRTCGQAFLMYADDHKGVMPYPTTTFGEQQLWYTAIDPYLNSLANSTRGTGVAGQRSYTEYKQCPTVNNNFNLAIGGSNNGTGGQNNTTESARSYKMNSYLRHNAPYGQAKIVQVPNTTNFVMMGDGVSMDVVGYGLGPSGAQFDNAQFSMDPSCSAPATASPPLVRHRGACNIVFVDGHAEAVKLKTITRPTDVVVGQATPVVTTFQTEYVDASGNPVYFSSGQKTIPAGAVRNPAMFPLQWTDIPNLSR